MMMTLPSLGRFVVPEAVASHFHLKAGDVVADFGAGGGFFMKALSKAVGPSGKVFACDIQKQLVDKLGDFARQSGLENVHPLWCDLEEPLGSKLPDDALDAAILVNTLFQFENKEAAVREIRRTLRSGGLLYVIDWSESFGGLGPRPEEVVSQSAAVSLFEANGFMFEREYPAGAHHYGLSFRVL
jgi:ubiquinone/menaquinone biosynthesis C-methylase UbiE